MAEQPPSEVRPKHSLLKRAARKIAPLVIVGITALTPDQAAHTPTIAVDPMPPPASAEKEKQSFNPSVVIVDAGSASSTDGIIQKEFSSNDDLAKKLLTDKFISRQQLIEEFGKDFQNKMGEVTKKYPQAMLYRFFDTYFNHGQDVAKTMEGTFGKSGFQSTGIELVPLQNAFDKEDIVFITDTLGNPGVSINFDPKKLIELLRNNPNRVVNMSFQVGNVEMFHEDRFLSIPSPKSIYGDGVNSAIGDQDGNVYIGAVGYGIVNGKTLPVDAQGNEVKPTTPKEQDILWQKAEEEAQKNAKVVEGGIHTKIVGAYDRSKALENLPKLFEVAKTFPDKLFFVAAGNEGEDLREALTALGSERPNNLVLVAESGWNGPTGNVYGADIYVDNDSLGVPRGSSFSTSVVSGLAAVLFSRNPEMTPEQIRGQILAAGEAKSYVRGRRGEIKEEIQVFNPQRLN